MSGSVSSASSGPRPKISCSTSVISASRSNRLSGVVWLSRSSRPRIRLRISGSASSRLTRVSRSRFRRPSSSW